MVIARAMIADVRPLAISTSNATGNIAISAALPATPGTRNYLSGFHVTGGGATSASTINVAITGLQAGTLAYQVLVPAGAGNSNGSFVNYPVTFPIDLPASATNSAITINVPSYGPGSARTAVCVYGFSVPDLSVTASVAPAPPAPPPPASPVPVLADQNGDGSLIGDPSVTCVAPLTTVVGDLLFVLLAIPGTGAITVGTGWSLIASQVDGAVSPSVRLRTYWRIADGTATDTFTATTSPWGSDVLSVRVTGADTIAPINVSGTSSTASVASAAAPTPTTTVDNTLVIRCVFCPNNSTLTPAGATSEFWNEIFNPGTLIGSVEACSEDQATAGATAARSWGLSPSEPTASITFAIKGP